MVTQSQTRLRTQSQTQSQTLSRRALLGLAAAGLALPRMARAETIHDLSWQDLVPAGEATARPLFLDVFGHDQNALAAEQPPSSGVRTDWNGQIVRMPGFIVPLELEGVAVTAFLLVPFVGACIHVPPPPANQLVFVTTKDPYETTGLFDPVTVTGLFGTSALSTELAQVGYAMAADTITRYRA